MLASRYTESGEEMSCEICGKTSNLKSCGRCLKVNYCSREHQIAHWKDHKPWCVMANGQLGNGGHSSATVVDQIEPNPACPNQPSPVDYHQPNTTLLNQDGLPFQSEIEEILSSMTSMTNYPQTTTADATTTVSSNSNIDSEQFVIQPQMNSLKECDYSKSSNANSNQDSCITTPPPTSTNSFNSHVMSSTYNSATGPDSIFASLDNYCQTILQDMNQYGFCVIDNFLQNGDLVLNEVFTLYRKGLFRAGQVVNNKANSNSKLIRGDQIIWVEGNEPICNNVGFLIRILDSIITRCNSMALGEFLKYEINRRTRAMIACYPGNYSKYVRHIDNPNNDGRCITSIYYLNKDYNRERDGGVLRLFPQMNDGIVADIEPKFNRVIFFWSDRRNPHEVMPSTRMRFAITVWYFDANERAKAIQKYKENSLQCPNDKDLVPF